jgi:hypothetical protein
VEGELVTVVLDDDLADVLLEGVELVSDNPSDWKVPMRAGQFDSVYDWWVWLHTLDTRHSPTIIRLMSTIIDSFSPVEGIKPGRHAKLYTAVERLYENGFPLKELERLFGLPVHELLGSMHPVWAMLHDGHSVDEVVEANRGIKREHVVRVAKVLAGQPVRRTHPKSMRAEAARLVDSGLTLQETAQVLSDRHGCTVTRSAVGSWMSRDRKEKV